VSWVLVYCLRVITRLVEVCIFDYENVWNRMIICFSYFSLPFLLVVCSVCVIFSLCDDYQIYWWEQIRELLVVNMETLLHSFGLDSAFQVSFKTVAHVFVCLLDIHFEYCRSLYFVLYWHRGVPQCSILITLDICKEWRYTPWLASYIILCDISFN